MKPYSREELVRDSKASRLPVRLMKSLRFVPEDITDWEERDFLVVTNKAGSEGILIFESRLLPFNLTKRKAGTSGRVEPIVCDFCRTWQRGSASAIMTFKKSDRHTISHLVCGDLNCSSHVRDKTDASKLSRTQLREHISVAARIVRLTERLREIVEDVRA